MPTYLVTWSEKQKQDADLAGLAAKSKAGKSPVFDWSTGNRRNIEKNDRIFLVRQGTNRGILASGLVVKPSYQREHWKATRNDLANYVGVRWDAILGLAEVLPVDILENADLGVSWRYMQGSGVRVSDESSERLEQLWESHLEKVGRAIQEPEPLPDEVPKPQRFIEGAVKQIMINAYERNTNAKVSCKSHHGLNCAVCNFNFADFYGQLGNGYIHVHHVRNLATIRAQYKVDPIKDLVPVCPNCHAMLHRTTPAMSIKALRAIIRRHASGKTVLRGAEVR